MEKRKEFVIYALYYGIISFLLILILFFLYRYCLLIIISFLSSSLIKPVFLKVKNIFHIKNRIIGFVIALCSVLVCYMVMLLFFVLTLYVLVQTFYYLPDYVYDVYQQLMTHRYLISISQHFYTSIDVFINHILSQVINFIWQILSNLPSILTYSFFHIILTVLFITYEYQVVSNGKYTVYLYEIYISVKNTLKILLKTYLFLFVITFSSLWLGFVMMGLSNGFVVAFLISLFDFFPILGLDMIFIPWIIVSVILNKTFFALQLLILYISVVIVRNILEPKLLSQQMKISLLPMFITLFIMMKVFGVLGMILSPFLLIVVKDLYNQKIIKNIIKD